MSVKRLRTRASLVATLAAAAGIGAWALAARPSDAPADRAAAARRPGAEAVGVVHVHTTHSDGALDVDGVVASAKAADLDFVVVTDHNTLDAKPAEGYAGDLLLIVGTEISTDAGHLLGLGFDEPSYRFPHDARDVLRDVADLGGAAFVAHPTHPKEDLRWTDASIPGGWGIELLNGDTQLRTAGRLNTLYNMLLYPLRRERALARLITKPDALELWDDLLSRRHAAGIAGADAHLRLPSYESVFRVARNHVVLDSPLTGDGKRDAAAIVEALSRGRAFIGVDAVADTSGFFFVAERGGRTWTMGDATPPHPALTLRAGGVTDARAVFNLLKDGEAASTAVGALDVPVAGGGVYRVEVTRPGWSAPWILSNPIYVFDEAERVRRRRRRTIPPPPPAAAAAAYLDRFGNGSVFSTASDPASSIAMEIEHRDGGAAARIAFRLGARAPAAPDPYVALTSIAARDLSAYDGLTLKMKADGTYRLWAQVRDRNPRSSEGSEWWSASLKATARWRRLTVPFDRLRSRDPGTDGRLDLKEIEAVMLIVDADSVPAGTEGTLWLDDVGLYRQ